MRTRLALLLLILGLLPAGGALAINRPGVLGSAGELYSVRTGTYCRYAPDAGDEVAWRVRA